jgi:hypothetical protein
VIPLVGQYLFRLVFILVVDDEGWRQ